jgi:hypothetical protein
VTLTDPLAVYAELLERARADPAVVGMVVVGPRAVQTYVHAGSDVDVYLVTRADDPDWSTPHGSAVEVWPMAIDAFRRHALVGEPDAWARPAFLRARVDLDRLGGEIARLVAAKATLTPAETRTVGAEALDGYLNLAYRSLRNLEAGRTLEGRLDGLAALEPALTSAFAMAGRVRPFNKWLLDELARRPLDDGSLLPLVASVASDPTSDRQRALVRLLVERARGAGFGAVVDGWEPDVAWLLGTRPPGPPA